MVIRRSRSFSMVRHAITPGDTATGADQHGDKGLTGQTELPEDTVQYESDTAHITAAFQDRQQEEQHQHLRYKAQHGANTGNNTVQQQTGQPFGRIGLLQQVTQQNRDTGHPNAVFSSVRRTIALFIIGVLIVGNGLFQGSLLLPVWSVFSSVSSSSVV